MDEVGQIWGSKVVDGLKCKQEDFDFETELNREPVELLEGRGDVVDGDGVRVIMRAAEFWTSWTLWREVFYFSDAISEGGGRKSG